MLGYPITLTPDDGALMVACPDLPEVASFGLDEADALRMASDAIDEALSHRLATWSDIPRPSDAPGPRAAAPLQTEFKVRLFWALRERGWTRADLVRALGWKRPQVDRLFDPRHATRLDQYERAFAALGRTLHLEAA
jgi:antitoxin HicB